MEAVGQVIVSLHRNLEEIRAAIEQDGKSPNSRETHLLQSTIDRAEAALRQQARQFLTGTQGLNGSPEQRAHEFLAGASARYDQGGSSSSNAVPAALAAVQRRNQGGYAPPPPARSYSPVPSPPAMVAGIPEGGVAHGTRRMLAPQAPPRGAARPARGRNAGPRKLLPKLNRLDPLADPPALNESDLQGGLQSLQSRGFIPPNSDLTPALERGMPILSSRPVRLRDQANRHERREVATGEDLSAMYRTDSRLPSSAPARQPGGGRASPQNEAGARSARQLPPLQPLGPAPVTLALPAPPQAGGYPAPQGSNVAQGYGAFCSEMLDAAPDDGTFLTGMMMSDEPRPAHTEEQRRGWAVTLIAAAWRAVLARRRVAQLRRLHGAARKIQSYWAVCLTRMVTKMKLHEIREEERKMHTRLMYDLGQDWFQAKQMRRVEVHICSLTVNDDRRRSCEGFQALQCVQIARIFRLLDPKRDVIFVAPKLFHEDILDYYAKMMQLRGIRNPPGRFQVVVPENMGLHHSLSLTQGLLCSPKALKRIRQLIQGRQAYVVPEVVTHSELKVCAQLQLPLLGPGPKNMALLGSKSNAKKLCQLAELPIGPWAVDIYDEDEFFTALAGLVVKHPEVKTWLFKIDDERDSRGHAYIDLSKFPAVGDSLMRSVEALDRGGGGSSLLALEDHDGEMGQSHATLRPHDEEPGVVGTSATEVRAILQRHVPRKVVMCNRRAYPDFAAWMAEASRVGAVIQAVPDGIVSQTSVHIMINPDGGTEVLGSSESVMSQPFVRAASWFPHTRGSWEVLKETGVRAGRALSAKGLVGFASVDVVFFDNPAFDVTLPEEEREQTPVIIGGETPVDARQLMFGDMRSPSPAMTEGSAAGRPGTGQAHPPLSESRQADYSLALQLREQGEAKRASDPVEMMLGGSHLGGVGASPSSRFACWIVDVDARLTDEAVALFPLQFVAQVKLDQTTGLLRQNRPEGSAGPPEDDTPERSQRWALVTHVANSSGMERMNYQSLFQVAKMKGVSFDLFNNVGCLFTHLDVFAGLFSVLAVDRTAEACAKRLSTAVSAIAEGSRKPSATGGRAKAAAPRDAPLLPGMTASEVLDTLSIADVQVALRNTLKRWVEKK